MSDSELRDQEQPEPMEEGGVPFFPHHLLREVTMIYLALAGLLLLLVLLPVEIRPPADPFKTPPHIKPEWYFLAMYQFLKLFPPQVPLLSQIPGVRAIAGEGRAASIIIQGLVFLAIFLLPFLDRNPERHPRRRPVAMTLGILFVAAVAYLAIKGHYS